MSLAPIRGMPPSSSPSPSSSLSTVPDPRSSATGEAMALLRMRSIWDVLVLAATEPIYGNLNTCRPSIYSQFLKNIGGTHAYNYTYDDYDFIFPFFPSVLNFLFSDQFIRCTILGLLNQIYLIYIETCLTRYS
jgi:hypothetical protein